MTGPNDTALEQEPVRPAATEPDVNVAFAKTVGDFTMAIDKWARSASAPDAPSLPRLKLLYTLACEGPTRMGDLAALLDVTPHSVTALVDGLETQGQVRRVADPADRRATRIELVEGQSDVEHEFREHSRMVTALFEDVGGEDRAAFLRVCRHVTERLRRA
jgi:DNA-binding MarR family transcriptional regulator